MARYEPKHVHQMDGSRCESFNCWASVGAWLTDGYTGGERQPEPTYFRYRAGKGGSDCQTGGLADMARGLANMGLWGQRARYRGNVEVPDFRAMLRRRSHNLVAIETDFRSWPDRDNCQPGYAGYHSVGVICGVGGKEHRGEARAMDPLCRTYRFVDIDGIIASALEYNREHQEAKGTIDCIVVVPPWEGK